MYKRQYLKRRFGVSYDYNNEIMVTVGGSEAIDIAMRAMQMCIRDSLIAGLPYEDYATFAKSFDEIYALKPNQLQLGFLKVLKGSYMYEHAAEYEIVYHAKTPYEVMKTKWLSFDDVLKIKQVEEMPVSYTHLYSAGDRDIPDGVGRSGIRDGVHYTFAAAAGFIYIRSRF